MGFKVEVSPSLLAADFADLGSAALLAETAGAGSIHLDYMDGDQFLLCSDGLSRLLSMAEIQNLMQTTSLEESVQTMIHTALVRGAPDNVTVISVQSDNDGTVIF